MPDGMLRIRRREWRFTDRTSAARFDAALAEAVRACQGRLERQGLGLAVHREDTAGVFQRRLESECEELLACVERLLADAEQAAGQRRRPDGAVPAERAQVDIRHA